MARRVEKATSRRNSKEEDETDIGEQLGTLQAEKLAYDLEPIAEEKSRPLTLNLDPAVITRNERRPLLASISKLLQGALCHILDLFCMTRI
jgi:hypothetical protein